MVAEEFLVSLSGRLIQANDNTRGEGSSSDGSWIGIEEKKLDSRTEDLNPAASTGNQEEPAEEQTLTLSCMYPLVKEQETMRLGKEAPRSLL
jgi:hypothetical protein